MLAMRRRVAFAMGLRPRLGAASQVFFFTLVTGPRRSLSLKLGDTRVYEPQIRARLGSQVLGLDEELLRMILDLE